MSTYIGKRVSYPCANCGKQFTLNKSSRERGDLVFCSPGCDDEHYMKNRIPTSGYEVGKTRHSIGASNFGKARK